MVSCDLCVRVDVCDALGVLLNPLQLLSPVVSAISGAFKARQERKTAIAKVKSAVEIKKTDANYQLDLKDKEWEALGKAGEASSWKDEFVVIVVFLPWLTFIVGAWTAPDLSLLDASRLMMTQINSLDTTSGYGLLLWVTALAGLGLKAWKR